MFPTTYIRAAISNILSSDQEIIATQEEWTAILKLSDLWSFDNNRNLAIWTLDSLVSDPVRRIEIARSFQIEEWVLPSLERLAVRAGCLPLNDQDAGGIGWDYACILYIVQEAALPTWTNRLVDLLLQGVLTVSHESRGFTYCSFCCERLSVRYK